MCPTKIPLTYLPWTVMPETIVQITFPNGVQCYYNVYHIPEMSLFWVYGINYLSNI